jgi:NAD(P)-dependent dehydrogenase (short-subunit alcohol dehydrogenase family)
LGKLTGKIAIVTGGRRGIGRIITEAYLEEDAGVITAAREKAEIEGLVKEAGPEKALALVADVTDPEDCERVVTGTVERFGKVDVLVNNAGRGMKYVSSDFLTEPTRFWEANSEVWK